MSQSKDFVEKEDSEFAVQLKDFKDGLAVHGTALGFTPLELSEAAGDADFFAEVAARQPEVQGFAQGFTRYKNLARYGNGSEVLGAWMELAPVPTPPTLVSANIESRFRAKAAKAKISPNYTQSIGETLRIVAVETPFDPNAGTPDFKVDLSHAGHPHITFKKGGWDGVEIWKFARVPSGTPGGGGGAPGSPSPVEFKKLERVFGREYVDPSPLPVLGSAEVWYYRMIYIYKNQQVGNWSEIESVNVGGAV